MSDFVDKSGPNKRRPVWEKAFLRMLGRVGVVRKAAASAGVSKARVYKRRNTDEKFRERWDSALDSAADRLELEVLRRARKGTLRPVFHKGVICGHVREFSDTLAIFLLKGMRPQKYRDNFAQQPADSADKYLLRLTPEENEKLLNATFPPGAIPALPREDDKPTGDGNETDGGGDDSS